MSAKRVIKPNKGGANYSYSRFFPLIHQGIHPWELMRTRADAINCIVDYAVRNQLCNEWLSKTVEILTMEINAIADATTCNVEKQ